MKRIGMWMMVLGLMGCAGAEGGRDVADLEKKVAQMERRLKVLEANAGIKSADRMKPYDRDKLKQELTGKGERPSREVADKSAGGMLVEVTGDEAKIMLLSPEKRRFRVPGKVPPGAYTVMASFGDAQMAEAGQVTVEADKKLALECTAASKSCAAK